MADYLDKKVMGGVGAEAVKITAPNVFPNLSVRKGSEVVLDPVSGNFFPRSLAASTVSGSNTHQSTYCSQTDATRAILTSDGTLIGIGAGENTGSATTAWRLTRWHLYPESSEVEYVGTTNVTPPNSMYSTQGRLSEFVEVEPDVFAGLFFSSVGTSYKIVKVVWDKENRTSALSISPNPGHASSSNRYHIYSDIIANNDGTFFVFGTSGKCDLWQTSDLTRLNYQLSTGAAATTGNFKNVDTHNNYSNALPLSDGRIVLVNAGNLLLREWTGTAFNEFGTNSATNTYNLAPLVKVDTDVFAMSYATNTGSIYWKVLKYDPTTQTLSDVVDKSFIKKDQTLTGQIQGSGRFGSVGSTFFGWNTDELYTIKFDPQTYDVVDESDIYISGYRGNRGDLTTFVIRPNGLCTSFMLGGNSYIGGGDAVYMTFNRFTVGNLLSGMGPIPCGIIYADATATELPIWITSNVSPGEDLEPLGIYGSKIAVTADHAIPLRNNLPLIERYTYNANDFSKVGISAADATLRVSNFYGSYSHTSIINKLRGVREIAKGDTTLNAHFSVCGNSGTETSRAVWGICIDGFQLFNPRQESCQSDYTYTPTVYVQNCLEVSCHIITTRSAYRDMYLFNKLEVNR